MKTVTPPANMILRACIASRGIMLEFPSIVFVDACELQQRLDPTRLYPPL